MRHRLLIETWRGGMSPVPLSINGTAKNVLVGVEQTLETHEREALDAAGIAYRFLGDVVEEVVEAVEAALGIELHAGPWNATRARADPHGFQIAIAAALDREDYVELEHLAMVGGEVAPHDPTWDTAREGWAGVNARRRQLLEHVAMEAAAADAAQQLATDGTMATNAATAGAEQQTGSDPVGTLAPQPLTAFPPLTNPAEVPPAATDAPIEPPAPTSSPAPIEAGDPAATEPGATEASTASDGESTSTADQTGPVDGEATLTAAAATDPSATVDQVEKAAAQAAGEGNQA